MEIRILAQDGLGEGFDQRTGGMAQGEIAGGYPGRRRDLVLAVERRQKRGAQFLRVGRQIIQDSGTGQGEHGRVWEMIRLPWREPGLDCR